MKVQDQHRLQTKEVTGVSLGSRWERTAIHGPLVRVEFVS